VLYAIYLDIRYNAGIEEKLVQMLKIGTAQIDFFAYFINCPGALRRKPDFIA